MNWYGYPWGINPAYPDQGYTTYAPATVAQLRHLIGDIQGMAEAVDEVQTTLSTFQSDVDQALAAAQAAQTSATSAQTAATAAQTTATAAQTTATQASTAASSAMTAATNSGIVATAAQNLANVANDAAGKAQNTADTANTAAQSAQTTATGAQTTATAAQTTATAAQTTATAAQTTATNAATTATNAETTAEDALSRIVGIQTAFYPQVYGTLTAQNMSFSYGAGTCSVRFQLQSNPNTTMMAQNKLGIYIDALNTSPSSGIIRVISDPTGVSGVPDAQEAAWQIAAGVSQPLYISLPAADIITNNTDATSSGFMCRYIVQVSGTPNGTPGSGSIAANLLLEIIVFGWVNASGVPQVWSYSVRETPIDPLVTVGPGV